jgi:pimeloyl-ACP methyl ester carboxylesterase
MGLGAFKTAWWRQTRHFGHTHASTYSCLIFDNRGMGKSAKPTTRYSTSEMALDVVDLLAALGWTSSSSTSSSSTGKQQQQQQQQRDLNIIGVSMGGMIAQEVALLLPDRISSLVLASTAPRLINEVGFVRNLRDRINLFVPRDVDVQLADTKRRLFPASFVEEADRDAYTDPASGVRHAWPTNGDRFAAGELRTRQDTEGFTRKGFMLQAIAAGWHHKSDAQLKELADRVGRSRICVVHGTVDGMISFTHAGLLKKGLGEGIVFKAVEGKGHMLPWEVTDEFHTLVEGMVEKAKAL